MKKTIFCRQISLLERKYMYGGSVISVGMNGGPMFRIVDYGLKIHVLNALICREE